MLTVLLGKGGGLFQDPISKYTVCPPGPIVAGDFTKDGKQDIFLLSTVMDYGVVYKGNGDGSFTEGIQHVFERGPSAIVSKDLNNDGRLDIITVGKYSEDVIVRMGKNPAGTFGPSMSFRTYIDNADRIVSLDFDSDGILDLAVANSYSGMAYGSLAVLKGSGNGSFGAPVRTILKKTTSSIASQDFDLDGRSDLLLVNAGNFSFLLSKGDGTFESANEIPAEGAYSTLLKDFNGDGLPDIIATGDRGVTLYLNCSPVGLADQDIQHDLKIFPNPSTGEFIISSPVADVSHFEMIDMLGKIVYSGTLNKESETIDCSSLPPAAYIIAVYHPAGIVRKKIVIE